MSQKINQEYLEALKYGDFKKEFEKLGISAVWKPGTKKAEMVQDALRQLKKLKELKAEGTKEEDLEKEAEKQAAKLKEKEEKAAFELEKKRKKAERKANKEALVKVEKKEHSIETLEKALRNTNANLGNAPSNSARQVLLNKKQQIMNLLGRK